MEDTCQADNLMRSLKVKQYVDAHLSKIGIALKSVARTARKKSDDSLKACEQELADLKEKYVRSVADLDN